MLGTLAKPSDLLIDQVRAIDNRRLIKGPVATLPEALRLRVAQALREVLDL